MSGVDPPGPRRLPAFRSAASVLNDERLPERITSINRVAFARANDPWRCRAAAHGRAALVESEAVLVDGGSVATDAALLEDRLHVTREINLGLCGDLRV